MTKNRLIIFILTLTLFSFYAQASGEKVLFLDNKSHADFINSSNLTSNAQAEIKEDILQINLTKDGDKPSFALPIEDMEIDPTTDNILAICLKTSYRTYEHDYAYAYFETDTGEGTVSANSYAVSSKWQVIYFRMGSNENFIGEIKSIRIQAFEKSPQDEKDLAYQIKWTGFFTSISEAQEYAKAYLEVINDGLSQDETPSPHKTTAPTKKDKNTKFGWGFVWTLIAMLAVTVILTYFIERERNKADQKKHQKKK